MKKSIIIFISIAFVISSSCKGTNDEVGDEISEFILAVEVTNKQTRNMVINNSERTITFDMARTETKTGVNIKLTLAEGVSMILPRQEQANYDLIYPAEIKLLAGGRTVIFTMKTTSVYDPMTVFILAAEVTNRQSRHVVIKNDTKEITFELANTESKTDVNIKLTLAEGVSMVSPAAEQAVYHLENPAQIELVAEDRKVTFAIKAGEFVPQPSPPAKKLVIGMWVPPPPHLTQNEENVKFRYKQIADAGMNMVWGNQWAFPSVPAVLNACHEYGLDFIVGIWVAKTGTVNAAEELARCLNTANTWKNYPAVSAFLMNDEPPASAFDRMAVVRREVDAILPEGKYTVTNLHPSYSGAGAHGTPTYVQYVEDYMAKVQPQVLSFDHYPLTNNTTNLPFYDRRFVSDLIVIRNAAIKYNVPFWGFIQAIGWSWSREPTYNEYRWLCNAHIAFGAKGYSYFLYSAIGTTGGAEGFTNSMLAWNGETTYLYDFAKNVNAEIAGFSDVVMPFTQDGFILTNQDAQMEATVPMNLRRTAYGNLSKIETVGEMMNGCFDLNGQKAVYLFNWSKDRPTIAGLTFNGIVNFQLWGKDGLEVEKAASDLKVSFLPGEAKFLIFM